MAPSHPATKRAARSTGFTSKSALGITIGFTLGALIIVGLGACTPTTTQVHPQSVGHRPQQSATTIMAAPRLGGEELELTPAEPDRFVDKELAGLEALGTWNQPGEPLNDPKAAAVSYDFPVIINKQVQFYLDFFQGDMRESFSRWLALSGRYVPMIQEELRAAGLPEDLAWLPMIESGYNLTAYSRARAVGPWQFMAPTARQYGLTINDYVDERRDPIRSTRAAVTFLNDLYNEFGCWHLAVAAYNAGNGRIRGAIRRLGTDNFWEIAQKDHLSRETRHYVPKLIAAIIIAKNPQEYGFDNVTYAEPLRYETMEVPRWTSLEAVAKAGNLELEELHDLNRQLRRLITPPEAAGYSLRLPDGTRTLVAKNLPRAPAEGIFLHTVQPGESLWVLARRYGVSARTIASWNNLADPSLVRAGQKLALYFPPAPGKADGRQPATKAAPTRQTESRAASLTANPSVLTSNAKQAPSRQPDITYYQVRQGDSLWSIARRFQTTPHLIQEWNQLNDDLILPGKKLILKLAKLTS